MSEVAQRGHYERDEEIREQLAQALLPTLPHSVGCHAHGVQSTGKCICVNRRAQRAAEAADALLPSVSRLIAQGAADAVELAARAVEELRPHIPPSTDPDRRTRIVQRSSFNRAASAVRAVAEGGKP